MTKEKFKQIRKNLNLTQVELAPLIYRCGKTVSNYERGEEQIPPIVADKMLIIEKYGV